MDKCCDEDPIELEIDNVGKTLALEVGSFSYLLSFDPCFL